MLTFKSIYLRSLKLTVHCCPAHAIACKRCDVSLSLSFYNLECSQLFSCQGFFFLFLGRAHCPEGWIPFHKVSQSTGRCYKNLSSTSLVNIAGMVCDICKLNLLGEGPQSLSKIF